MSLIQGILDSTMTHVFNKMYTRFNNDSCL